MKAPGWFKPIAIAAAPEPEPVATHLVCGVPACADGRIVQQDERETVVECDTHEARTTHDTTVREAREQRVIRVQDSWRQHGSQPRQ